MANPFTISLTEETKRKLGKIAEKKGVSKAAILKIALQEYVEKDKKQKEEL